MTIGDTVRGVMSKMSGAPARHEDAELLKGSPALATQACAPCASNQTTAAGIVNTTTTGAQARTEEVPVGVVETTTTTAVPVVAVQTRQQAAAAGEATQTGRAAVCGQEYFTKTEDRPIIIEKREQILEHRPVSKEFVVETRATGVERSLPGHVEHLGTTERVVSEAAPKDPCA